MKCYLCKAEAKEVLPTGDFKHIQCAECGEYKIANTAVAMAQTRNVDVRAMQEWLKKERQRSTETPLISSINMVYK